MPGLDGWGFLRRLRATPTLCSLPVVLVSASEALRPEGFPAAADFDLVLVKPLDDDALARFLLERLAVGPAREGTRPRGGVRLQAAELARFKEMLADGQMHAIAAWARKLAAVDDTYRSFADQVLNHCRAANLLALEDMARAVKAAGE